jgi:methionyl-tRNA formyltransferase
MKPKIVFFGTPEFAIPSFKACSKYGNLVAVVTQPDRPRGRGLKISPCEVKSEAQKLNIPVYSPEKLGTKGGQEAEELFSFLNSLNPDLFIVTAYGNLLPERFLQLPKVGCFNVHASLLPKWRGAAPIQRSLEAGDKITGVCLQKMVKELDAGDVYKELTYEIQDSDNAESLFKNLATLADPLIENLIKDISFGNALSLRKQDSQQVTIASKISKEEGYWDSSWTSNDLFFKVRAFSLWPGVKVFSPLLNCQITIEKVRTLTSETNFAAFKNVRSGEFFLKDNKLLLKCAVRPCEQKPESDFIEIETVKVPGKGSTSAFNLFTNEFNKQKCENSEFLSLKNHQISL